MAIYIYSVGGVTLGRYRPDNIPLFSVPRCWFVGGDDLTGALHDL